MPRTYQMASYYDRIRRHFIAAMTDGQFLVGQTNGSPLPKTMTGDGTLTKAGLFMLAAITNWRLAAATEVTLDTDGSIETDQTFHKVDTFEDAASDNLDTIVVAPAGTFRVLCLANVARNVVLRHGQDNIYCPGAQDIVLDAAGDMALLVCDGSNWIVLAHHTLARKHLDVGDLNVIHATVGNEAANKIEVACHIDDVTGTAVASAHEVCIEVLAVTDGKGDIAAAAVPVGTLNKANNPAAGVNTAHMTTTVGGAFSFSVEDDQVEKCLVKITAEGCRPKVINLNFAA